MEIKELFKEEQKYWKRKNISLFGINPVDMNKPFSVIQESINKSCKQYWNVDKPCKLAILFNDGTLDKDYDFRKPLSYRLELNIHNMCIDIYNTYLIKSEEVEYKIATIPTPEINLSWVINNANYTPRVTAISDSNTFIRLGKKSGKILGEFWTYDPKIDVFECSLKKDKFNPTVEEIFNRHLSKRTRAYLQALLKEVPLTEETFTDALKLVTELPYNSIFGSKFTRFEYFEDLVLNIKKYAYPSKNILLGINTLFVSQAKQWTTTGEKLEGQLILSQSPINSLEQFRTVVNIYKNDAGFTPQFSFIDTTGFFDSFKTATSNSAGRQRLLLDNILVKDGMLWIREEDGSEHNMFEYMQNPQDSRISCLSYSPFCHNNQSKRIMMTAKMGSQAVPLKSEKDSLTHRLPARVIFADIEGYTYGDSIVISESFAKKLETFEKDIITLKKTDTLYNKLFPKGHENNPLINIPLSNLLLSEIYPNKAKAIIDNYKDAKIDFCDVVNDDYVRVFISWKIPFGLGDKISNLHGAKGVVGKILPDNEMPRLTKKAGIMEPGPLEVVISGFSTLRRGSLGQLFEAWYNASGLDIPDKDKFISIVSEKYGNQIKKFTQNSIVEFNGEKSVKPIGIIDMIRLYHHASTHISESDTRKDFNKMLKLGEMEKFNLLASKSTNILKELSIRSMQKYIGSHKMISDMQKDRQLPENPILSLRFAKLLKSFGYNITLDNKPLVESDISVITLSDDIDKDILNSWIWEE